MPSRVGERARGAGYSSGKLRIIRAMSGIRTHRIGRRQHLADADHWWQRTDRPERISRSSPLPCFSVRIVQLCTIARMHIVQSGAECFFGSLFGIKLIDCEFEQLRVIHIQPRSQEGYPFKRV